MAKNTQKLRRALSRDGNICGAHWGGCGRKMANRKDASLDHIIPQSYLESMDSETRTEFRQLWNLQPMCRKCNNEKKGQVWGWPLFRCRCHWLQVTEDGKMWVWESTEDKPKRHLLGIGAVSEGLGVEFTGRIGSVYMDGEWWRGVAGPYAPCPVSGHMMTCIPRFSLPAFNWFELARVGRVQAPLITWDSGWVINFFPQGRVGLSFRGREYYSTFKTSEGHKNGSVMFFVPGEKVWMKVHEDAVNDQTYYQCVDMPSW